MKNKIRFRLFLYFSGSLLVFSLVLSLVFSTLFSRHNMDIRKDEMESRARRIADSLGEFWTVDTNRAAGHGMMGQGMGAMGYGAYLRFLDDIAMADIWIVDKNLEQITRGRGQVSLSYKDLPPDGEKVIAAALEGKTNFCESFDELLDAPSITVASPVIVSKGEIAGAVLLHDKIENIQGRTRSGFVILIFSILAAVIVSSLLSNVLAIRFTSPLGRMKTAAIKISGGDYSARSYVSQKDEIGELASALDDMAKKLAHASDESAKLDKLRRDFVSNISHELRTPVTVIRGSLEAICDGVVVEAKMIEEYHRQMLVESLYLERLISDLLDLSRLQNPDLKMEIDEVDLKNVTEDASRSIRPIARKKDINVKLSFGDSQFTILGDYGRLRQLVLILLHNAVKFSPHGGEIRITLLKDTNSIVLTVIDKGQGIAPEDLPYIFERFYRQPREENKEGTGLGLAIARQIAERHRGMIEAQNGPECGAVFRVIFNVDKSRETPTSIV